MGKFAPRLLFRPQKHNKVFKTYKGQKSSSTGKNGLKKKWPTFMGHFAQQCLDEKKPINPEKTAMGLMGL